MSAANTLTVNTVALVFLLATLISPMTAEPPSKSTGINQTEHHSVRHQPHRVLSGGTDNDDDMYQNDDRRTRGISGIQRGLKHITAAHASSPIFIVASDKGPEFRAINHQPNANASFAQKSLCDVDATITDEWFKKECDVDSIQGVIFPLVYIIEFKNEKYLMCANEEEKSVVPVKRSDIQNREEMKRCLWDIVRLFHPRGHWYIRSYFPSGKQRSNCNGGQQDNCTRYTFMFAKPSKRKFSKLRLKLRTLPLATHKKKLEGKPKYQFLIYSSEPSGQTWAPRDVTTTSPGQGGRNRPDKNKRKKSRKRGHGRKKGKNLFTKKDGRNLFETRQSGSSDLFSKDKAVGSPRRHTSVLDGNQKLGL